MSRLLACLAVLLALGAPVRSEEGTTVVLRQGLDQAQVDALLAAARAVGRPVTLRWADPQGEARTEARPAAPVVQPTPTVEATPALALAFESGLAARVGRLTHLGDLGRDLGRAWGANTNGTTGDVLVRLLAALGLAIAAGYTLRHLLSAFGRRHPLRADGPPPDLVDRVRRRLRGLVADLLAAGAFVAVAQVGVARLLPQPDLARAAGAALLQGILVLLLYRAAGRFLLAPHRPDERPLPLPRPSWHYGMLLLYAVVGQAVTLSVGLLQAAGGDPLTLEAWFLVGSTVITAQKLWWFWYGRHDFAAALLPEGGRPSLARRLGAHALPWLMIAVGLLIWAAGNVAAAEPETGVHWGRAAGATQILVVLLPILALGCGALAEILARRHQSQEAARLPEGAPRRRALAATVRTLVIGGIWVIGILVVARIWDAFLRDPASVMAVRGVVRFGAALVAGWAAWTFLQAYFEAHLPRPRVAGPHGDDEAEPLVQSRLATVLPMVRYLALGAVVALSSLVALSALGVDIAPLLAGFGVVGLAISFGSQALVRDVVSGIFFMADDAFRVGEYVDTGRLKGTVEKITLRSVQLRHQNGQIHTVPFGQIQAVTNFSRDWATMKFAIRLDREADVERARKTIKRVGQEMLDDPESGPEFIQPLKMQGIQEITETAIVVRCKFTSTPSKPTWLQREALKRIHRALNEAGVAFASNAVSFRAGEPTREGAAAALRPQPTPEPA